MAFIIYGAGAVGGALGGFLLRAGHDVTLIARGAHLDAIRRDGLRVETPDGPDVVAVPAVSTPAEADIEPGDAVILTMKTHDTADALTALRQASPPGTPVVCAQNGVANERMALRLFENVYGVCVMFPATFLEPGVVLSQSAPVPGLLDIGRYPGGVDGTAEQISAAFRLAGFDSMLRPDVMRWKYRKLVMNLRNAVQAVCGGDGTGGEIRALFDLVCDEGEACLKAAGIDVASADEELARRGDLLQEHEVAGRSRAGGSSWQSLQRGVGSIETDFLNGEIVLLGRLHAVPTPANDLIRQLATKLAHERRPPGSVPAAEVLARLE